MAKKYKVQKQIRDAREKHEIKITGEIRAKMRAGGNMWECLNKLRGINKERDDSMRVYGEDRVIMEEREAEDKVEGVFRVIYKTGQREITPVHSGMRGEGAKEELKLKYEASRANVIEMEGITVHLGMSWSISRKGKQRGQIK